MHKKYYEYISLAYKIKSIDIVKSAIEILPQYTLAHLLIIFLYLEENNIEEAQKYYELLISQNPNINLTISYSNKNDVEKLFLQHMSNLETQYYNEKFESVLNFPPLFESTFVNIGSDYIKCNDLNNALKTFNKGISLFPESLDLQYDKGSALLFGEEIETGWESFEKREIVFTHHKPLFSNIPKYELQKQGKLLIYYKAGFGDTIFFSRYLEQLKNLNIDFYIYVQPELYDLYKSQGYNIVKSPTEINFDYQISFMSLPWLFKTELDTIPKPDKYITISDSIISSKQKLFLSSQNKKIGIVWRCGANDSRTIQLEQLNKLFELEKFDYYSLQKDINENELNFINSKGIINLANSMHTFEDTAALIENLDLIVGCDTAITNLSCSMGKETLILLPYHPAWRWRFSDFYTPWYNSARLFRQNTNRYWDTPINTLYKYLNEF